MSQALGLCRFRAALGDGRAKDDHENRNRSQTRGYFQSRVMDNAKNTPLAALRNALAALIGYPSNLEGALSRRLEG